MNNRATTKTKRVDFTLPIDTINLLNKTVPKGKKSELVNKALQVYIRHLKQKDLRKSMREEALADAGLDLHITGEWSAVDQEAWQQIK
jgi:hypothetical protein